MPAVFTRIRRRTLVPCCTAEPVMVSRPRPGARVETVIVDFELPAEAVFCSAATTGFDDAVAATGTAARASTATTIFTRRPMDRWYSDPGVVQSRDRRCYAC